MSKPGMRRYGAKQYVQRGCTRQVRLGEIVLGLPPGMKPSDPDIKLVCGECATRGSGYNRDGYWLALNRRAPEAENLLKTCAFTVMDDDGSLDPEALDAELERRLNAMSHAKRERMRRLIEEQS